MIRHPLFTKKHCLDSIRVTVKEQKQYSNPVNKTVFVGYDNKNDKKNFLPLAEGISNNNDQSPFDDQLLTLLSLAVLAALLATSVSLMLKKAKANDHPLIYS